MPPPASSLVRASTPLRPGCRPGCRRAQPQAVHRLHRRRQLRLIHVAAAVWLRLPDAHLAHVATTRSLSAVNAQRRFGFTTASTNAHAVLEDETLDAIFVVTRHATHADLVRRALETGKAVFVEKPLALTTDELDRINEVVTKTGNDRLMVGFNRRFAPMLAKMKAEFGPAASGSLTRYLVNAGSAGRRQLVPQRRRGVPVHRRGRSLPGHAELVGGQPARGGIRGRRPGAGRRPSDRAVRQRHQRRDHIRHDR